MKQIFIFLLFLSMYQHVLCADSGLPIPEVKPAKIMSKSLADVRTITELSTFLNRTQHGPTYSIQDVTDSLSQCDETDSQVIRKLFALNRIKAKSGNITLHDVRTIIHIAAKAPEHADVVDGYTHRHSIHTHYLRALATSKTLDSSSDKDVH